MVQENVVCCIDIPSCEGMPVSYMSCYIVKEQVSLVLYPTQSKNHSPMYRRFMWYTNLWTATTTVMPIDFSILVILSGLHLFKMRNTRCSQVQAHET